jgi:hypothetical protein
MDEQLTALSESELLEALALVLDELRKRGILFAALPAIVDWQDRMFLEDNGVAS